MFPNTNLLSICSRVLAFSKLKLGTSRSSSVLFIAAGGIVLNSYFKVVVGNAAASSIGIVANSNTSPSILPVPCVLGITTIFN